MLAQNRHHVHNDGGDGIGATPVVVLKLDRDRLLALLDSHMESSDVFFKDLYRA